jgi:endonuclease/exonuclease/phosphatase family metal-dependent hydrolase
VRVATYNIRTVRALDWHSLWWRRRRRLAAVVADVGADLWGLQEVWPSQLRWLRRTALTGSWATLGTGRNAGGGGEASPILARTDRYHVLRAVTRWYGDDPERPGSRLPGARSPRIATIAELVVGEGDAELVVANTHLDEASEVRRHASTTQLAGWLREIRQGRSIVVLGDLNCTLDDPPMRPLLDLGLRATLTPSDGPTSTGRGDPDHQQQIDHVLVSDGLTVRASVVHRGGRPASDHWPVVVDLTPRPRTT